MLLESRINCFLGKNGSGKTNVLDAIHYLSFTKSFVNASDSMNIRKGENQLLVKGTFLKSDKLQEVICTFQLGQKKIVREEGKEYQKFSEHLGKYPVVMVIPQDIELIWNGGEARRKFFDSQISQIDRQYLDNLIIYTNSLKQRNSLLKVFSEKGSVDYDLLAGYDIKLALSGKEIYQRRLQFAKLFIPRFREHYSYLSGESSEEVDIRYFSELEDQDFGVLLERNLGRDIAAERTLSGIHRDEFEFLINGSDLKRMGSQGQQKSFLIGLKMAEFDTITEHKGFRPILLLDDIFDKLDDIRINKLMLMVGEGKFGQIYITDARPQRTLEILSSLGDEASIFRVENGKIDKWDGKIGKG